jgi:hypothetical protein
MPARSHAYQIPAFCLLLICAIVAAYWSAFDSEFIRFDDPAYVTRNELVRGGLTLRGLAQSFTTVVKSNWHPVTMISHMATVELVGLDPGAHHAVNVWLHVVNALLLFAVMRSATGEAAPSALIAILFGLHPVHVESVAWVSERKDLLAGFFWLSSTAAYLRYVRSEAGPWFYATGALLILGLLAKPMLVTLPFVLLLLDHWPLRRLTRRDQLRRCVTEKIPLVIVVMAFSAIAVVTQQQGGGLAANARLPIDMRLFNAIVSYPLYLAKLVWPTDLALLYPHPYMPSGVPWRGVEVAGAGLVFAALSCLASWRGGYVAVGWWWFAISMVPVIGVLQLGAHGMADRYLYLPAIGIYLIVAFSLRDLFDGLQRHRWLRIGLIACILSCIIPLSLATRAQVGRWHDSISIFTHSVEVAPNHTLANNLGNALYEKGRVDEAIERYRQAIELYPGYRTARGNLRRALQAATDRSDSRDSR